MEASYSTIDEPGTAASVLEVLRDMQRQESQFDPNIDPKAELSLETTVAEWRTAWDLGGWRALGRACNQRWDMQCPDADWHAALEPPRARRLTDGRTDQLAAGTVNRTAQLDEIFSTIGLQRHPRWAGQDSVQSPADLVSTLFAQDGPALWSGERADK
jgi:hypothetical protein